MPAQRFGRLQKATALLPLALLSAAWTASLAGAGATAPTAVAEETQVETLPDGTSVPTQAIEAPASVSSPDSAAPGLKGSTKATVVKTASTSAIPSAALSAYQRAETVINAADKSCNLQWQLVAAIGRVESNHGRYGGSTLNDEGVARPGIIGIALNGKNNTARISDTDAGQYDNDLRFDRAVGPMQFIPSTWSVVGVDADGDGQRNPQDIDDAALATAVYLCSGNDDLSAAAGQRSAVYRYNNSQSYVNLVLSIAKAYLAGDFTPIPNSTVAAGVIVPDPDYTLQAKGPQPQSQPKKKAPAPGTGGTGSGPDSSDPDPEPQPPAQPPPPPSGGDGGGGTVPVKPPKVNVPPPPTTGSDPVDEVLTQAQAIAQCIADGYVDNPLDDNDAFDRCVKRYTS